jgi:GntR family histidine utilization transcriptional repressor
MIEAALPGELEAKLLGIARRSPCLVLKRITYSRGVAVTSVKLTHPGGRYQLQGSFSA